MKNKEESLTPDSANISDMQTNDDEDDRAESRERSRGKRRTAREIATMFEQLKQRHISRKKEWQEEKEDLLKKVQMADESKRVLNELKCILENLREELRLEERKRIEMEEEHFAEKQQWEQERENLLQRLQHNTNESRTVGQDIKSLTDKITEQSKQLTEWQNNVLELKKQLLEKENKMLREKRDLQLELEKERISWKKKEGKLNEKIRQLDNKSAQSSTSSTSPINLSYPNLDDENKSRGLSSDNKQNEGRKSSTSSMNEPSRYNNFQRTVDDALKQIEKISKDLKDVDQPIRGTDSQLATKRTDREFSTPSPRPHSNNSSYTRGGSDDGPSPNAPWRTRRKTSQQRPNLAENPLLAEDKSRLSSTSAKSDSPIDVSISLPLINTAQLKMKRSPNPERKVRKISRQGGQVDVTVSSPEAISSKTNEHSLNFPLVDKGILQTGSSQNFVDAPKDFIPIKADDSEKVLNQKIKASQIGDSPQSLRGIADRNKSSEDLSVKESATRHRTASSDKMLSVQGSEITRGRSASPRLPKLHQQLLFKKDDKSINYKTTQQRSLECESLTSTDKGKTSEDELTMFSDIGSENKPLAHQKNNVASKVHTPYFDPKVSYVNDNKIQNKQSETSSKAQANDISPGQTPVSQNKRDSEKMPKSVTGGDVIPPAVHPKPKVSIHKDQEGNILGVSPTSPTQDISRKSISPDSTPGSEKQYSIAGRMGRAGRDWIKKKLSFKEKRLDDEASTERTQDTPTLVDQPKKRGKTRVRQRSSSLLRNRAGGGKSFSTTEESSDSEREGRKRESFLRRSKRKSKANTNINKSDSPAKSKPKKYTRSKTEASPKEMRNFLAKFKASQSNPNKPSVVKQFELKLLENEVKTLSEENNGTTYPHGDIGKIEGSRLNNGKKTPRINRRAEDGYVSGDEGDGDGQFPHLVLGQTPYVPSITQKRENSSSPSRVALRQKAKLGPPVKPKTYHRKSMPDFSNRHVHFKSPTMDEEDNQTIDNNAQKNFITTSPEKGILSSNRGRERKGVLSLVDKFSAKAEEVDTRGTGKALQDLPLRRSSLKLPDSSKKNSDENIIPRSHSMSSHDKTSRPQRISKLNKIDDESKSTSNTSWRDRVMFTPDTPTTDSSSVTAPSGERLQSRTQRASAPPGQYDSAVGFWNQANLITSPKSVAATTSKTGRMKIMSEEMKRKTDMLEKALSKGPRKPRRYKRADTQPVYSNLSSSDMSDTDDVLNLAFRPFIRESRRLDDGTKKNIELSKDDKLHDIIPPVTGKFSKPARPGRLPSRWAR